MTQERKLKNESGEKHWDDPITDDSKMVEAALAKARQVLLTCSPLVLMMLDVIDSGFSTFVETVLGRCGNDYDRATAKENIDNALTIIMMYTLLSLIKEDENGVKHAASGEGLARFFSELRARSA